MKTAFYVLAIFFMASAVYEQTRQRYDRAAYYASVVCVMLLAAQ